MKPILLLLALSLLFTGCLRYPATYPTYDRLVNLPTEAHEREVSMLFASDPLPSEPYVRLGMVEVHGSGFTSYNELIRSLQAKAQKLGADAVQLSDKKYTEDTYGSGEAIYTDTRSNLAGLGILYLKNATYLDRYVEAELFYPYNDSTGQYGEVACRIVRTYNDQPSETIGDKSYADFVATYSLEHLRYEEAPDWEYYLDERGRARIRVYRPNGLLVKKCWFTYNGYGQVTEVRIRHFYPQRVDEKVVVRYDEQKNVAEKQIYQEGRLVYREIPAYDVRGLRAGSASYLAQDGSPDRPYLKVVYQFFDPSQLPLGDALVNAEK